MQVFDLIESCQLDIERINNFLAVSCDVERLPLKGLFLHLAMFRFIGLNALTRPAENFKIGHSISFLPVTPVGQPWIYSLQRFLNSLAMFSIIWAVL